MKRLIGLCSASLICSSVHAAQLTTYLTEWSGYSDGTYPAYAFDGSYPSSWGSTTAIANPDMADKASKSDVIEFAFLQVWNQDLINQYINLGAKQEWLGTLHFDDLWANLSNPNVPDYAMWQKLCTPNAGTFAAGTCAAVQMNGNTGQLQVLDYSTSDQWSKPGQMDNFGAFLKLKTTDTARKVIAIGGANTLSNQSVSTKTYQAIFANQTVFLNSLSAFMNALQSYGFKSNSGVDYDFEPPINDDGSQKQPDASTQQDYRHLYDLVVASRAKLGPDAYVSVTLTVNKDYLEAINASVDGGWFKQIQSQVNAINLMTYDLHGPWSLSSDPGAISHVMLKQPSNLSHTYAINDATEEVVNAVLGYGVDANKLQIGLASYGRGFAGVASGNNSAAPGFDQAWTGAANFPAQYANQVGMLPYKFVDALVAGSDHYKKYQVSDGNSAIASYIYSDTNQQLVGYMSPELVDSTCAYIQSSGLQGAILWSADTDASYDGSQGISLISRYNDTCRQPTQKG